ncbi:Na+ efflux pump ABC transporter permease [Catenovulum agarivorans DS-2]|uniref:Na+ efflux pump ABC transporter permease n=1 Tax=Catenovulum agarivorans DS-2 TaxID=1328313 RepID=W7R398_9ALTE|nr:ABC transporter permease subunit [Catenovulum agarivorans]EWH12100.1 Na+ efflux pump ABC transporter permease [Catenovulum agarivorans DS-2]
MISVIYKKEMLELIRDKKTLVFMILLPLLIFPALFGALAVFASHSIQKEQTRTLTYIVTGANALNPVLNKLAEQTDFKRYQGSLPQDIQGLIRQQKIDFWLDVSPQYLQEMAGNQQSQWKLYFNNASGVNSAVHRVERIIRDINTELTEEKLLALGIDADSVSGVLTPIKLVNKDIAKAKESLGSKLGGLVAYILLPLCLLGAIYPAVDIAAGEKERGTLESLLITPSTRLDLVMGKFLTVFSASFISAFSAIFSLAFWSFIFAQGFAIEIIAKVVGTLGIFDLLLALLMMLPLVMSVSALVLCISIYAKNFKEAQNFMAPLSFLIFVPLIAAMMPGIELNWQWAFVPISNVALAIKEILKGQGDSMLLLTVWSSQLIAAIALLAFATYWFKREAVLFRT